MSGRARTRRAAVALGLAGAAHLALLAGLDHVAWFGFRLPGLSDARVPLSATPQLELAAVDLLDVTIKVPELPIEAVTGSGDYAGVAGTHPMPNASADLAGKRAADRGGGAVGGAATWTGRRDKLDDVALRAEVWNGGVDYRAAHRDSQKAPRSPEALLRQPNRDYGDRQIAKTATAGDPAASIGDATDGVGGGQGELPSWRDADPMFDLQRGRTAPQRTPGAPQPTREAPLATIGERSDDVLKRGRAGDNRAVAAASDEATPDPFDWTQPRSGGTTGEGVAGKSAPGMLADGRGRKGDAASTSASAAGGADLSITAERQDPYFRDLYRQLDRLVAFPRDLAIALESGWVTGVMRVDASGAISGIKLERSSGQVGFDDALLAALKRVTLGPVPARLLDGHRALRVRIPYTFRNPLVR